MELAVSRGGVREDRGRHARGDRRERRGGRTWPLGWVRALPPRVRGRGDQQILPSRGGSWAGHAQQMGPRGSAGPTHDGRDGLPPVRGFSPRRRHRQHAEASRGHGRIRAPPRREFRLQAPGPHTMPGRVDARFRTRPAPASRAVCDAPHAEGNSATRSSTPRHIRRRLRHFRSHPTIGMSERTDCCARSKWRRTLPGR